MATRKQGSPGWRTEGAGGIGLGQLHTLAGEAIEVGRVVKGRAATAQIPGAKVINQDHHQVGAPQGFRRARGGYGHGGGHGDCGHDHLVRAWSGRVNAAGSRPSRRANTRPAASL